MSDAVSLKAEIARVLPMLDPDTNDHWTADGAPRVGAVRALVDAAVSEDVTREAIAAAAPGFNRSDDLSADAPDDAASGAAGRTDAPAPAPLSARDVAANEVAALEARHTELAGIAEAARLEVVACERSLVAARDRLAAVAAVSESDEMQAWLAGQNRQRGHRHTQSVRVLNPADAAKTPIERALESRPRQVPGSGARSLPKSDAR